MNNQWIILEGLDRTGKSSMATSYQNQGYEVVHMSAPDKKYSKAGYTGPSYLDDLVELYMRYSGRNVVFDRSPYGELVWPQVYNRESQLTEDDFEVLREIEDSNNVQRVVMHDPNISSHWQRCVENSEPLTKSQFIIAGKLFDKLASEQGFTKKTLHDNMPKDAAANPQQEVHEVNTNEDLGTESSPARQLSPEMEKLELANAIDDVLSSRIIKKKGLKYDLLEGEIRNFLKHKMSTIFGTAAEEEVFTKNEIQLLKLYCSQLNKRLKEK